ncbi:MAG: 6-phosphofructokinase [Pseudomonadales bacterium]
MAGSNIFYAQSGGVTAVINASACGVIETARETPKMGKVFVGKNGILGALNEELIDTSLEPKRNISGLRHTPSGAFGSCRFKLKSPEENPREYQRILEVFKAHGIGYFFYNGGGDSQDTANKVAAYSTRMGYPVQCIGIPKTVDNDLPFTDTCPGFGSVAKYVAISTLEAGLDVASMAASSTKVFVLEVMGRHAGWIAAASALAATQKSDPPHLVILPEVPFDQTRFLKRVAATVAREDYCVIVASEGAQTADGRFLAESGGVDAFGHAQLGGVAPMLVDLIKNQLGFKCHWAVSDYLQRAARHVASKVDVDQAYAVGASAVRLAASGKSGVMVTLERSQGRGYRWRTGSVALSKVANVEKKMPKKFITRDGWGITEAGLAYLRPLVRGEDYPPYDQGIPRYVRLKNNLCPKKLPPFEGN